MKVKVGSNYHMHRKVGNDFSQGVISRRVQIKKHWEINIKWLITTKKISNRQKLKNKRRTVNKQILISKRKIGKCYFRGEGSIHFNWHS